MHPFTLTELAKLRSGELQRRAEHGDLIAAFAARRRAKRPQARGVPRRGISAVRNAGTMGFEAGT